MVSQTEIGKEEKKVSERHPQYYFRKPSEANTWMSLRGTVESVIPYEWSLICLPSKSVAFFPPGKPK